MKDKMVINILKGVLEQLKDGQIERAKTVLEAIIEALG
jgi:hypothetical protein